MEKFGRRQALSIGLVAAAISRIHPAQAASYPPLTATVSLGSKSYVFREDQGTDLGDFVSDVGGFTQRCIRTEVTGCPLTIFFRPDRTSDRAEVVFELGQLFNSTPANLGAYSVTIARSGQTLATVAVPQHYWFSRWRWQSAARPVVGKIDTLMTQNLLPHYALSAPAAVPSQPAPQTQPASQQPAASAIMSGLPVGGTILPMNISGTYPLSLKAGQKYMFQSSASGLAQVMVAISLNGAYLASNVLDGSTMPFFFFQPSAAGTYALVVASVNNFAGTYTVQVLGPNGSPLPQTAPVAAAPAAASPAASAATYTYAVMGLAGITPRMGLTGERADIGLVTGPQGEYICTRSGAALADLRAQAEGAGTLPWHMRDENTGAPIDFRTYPKAGWYSDARVSSPNIPLIDSPMEIDSAHQPALAYLPYLLTGDPYHLEDMQFAANWNWGVLPPNYRPSIPQARAFAWSTRTLAQCARVTPKNVPSWLLPQIYWSQMLTTTRQYFEADFVNSARPERARFRATGNVDVSREEPQAPAGTWVDPWQDEFVGTVLGWVVSMGFSDWRTSFDWVVGGSIARSSGKSGWARSYASPYRMIVRASAKSPVAGTWAEAWQLSKQIAKLNAVDTETWASSDLTYLTYLRGALTYAQRLNTANVSEAITWADAQIAKAKWPVDYKWRLLPS